MGDIRELFKVLFCKQDTLDETAAARLVALEAEVTDLRIEMLEATAAMFDKPCPFRGELHCHAACVHFISGRAYISDSGYYGAHAAIDYPRCQLWMR